MSAPGHVPYYAAYEERLRSVYAQDVRYWSAFPEERAAVEAAVTAFLERARPSPGAQVIEFGCGEGFVGQVVAGRGCAYAGVNLALRRGESAGAAGRLRGVRRHRRFRPVRPHLHSPSAHSHGSRG